MDFLRFILASIFLGILGLFLYRYEQVNRFSFKIKDNAVYIIDKKHNRVIKNEHSGFKVIIKGNEDFLNDYFAIPGEQEVSPLPKEAEPYAEQLPLDVPNTTPTNAELAVQEFENPRETSVTAPREEITPPIANNPTSDTPVESPISPPPPQSPSPIRKIAEDAAKNAAGNILGDPKNYNRFIGRGNDSSQSNDQPS